MSLYDTIQCDYPLPDPEFQHEHFQTRDINCTLSHYLITTEGRLWRLRRADAFSDEAPLPDSTGKTKGINYHGELNFYADVGEKRIEYRARFTHGVVEWIRRVGEDETVVDSPERLATDVEDLQMRYWMRLEEFLRRLEDVDPELANRVIEVWGDRDEAAVWLATVQPALKTTSYRALASGKRQAVLDILGRLQHGLPG